jgi:hypothetical protein
MVVVALVSVLQSPILLSQLVVSGSFRPTDWYLAKTRIITHCHYYIEDRVLHRDKRKKTGYFD